MNIERIDSGPNHLDRAGEEWWTRRELPEDDEELETPTHMLNGHTMVYTGASRVETPPEHTARRQAEVQQALQQSLKELS